MSPVLPSQKDGDILGIGNVSKDSQTERVLCSGKVPTVKPIPNSMKPYFDQLPRIPFPSMVTFPTTKSLVGTPASASIHLPVNLETTANMSTTQEMLRESVALTHAMNRVESLIAMLIPGKIKVNNEDLEMIQDKFFGFSRLLLTFSMKFSRVTRNVPVTIAGVEMTPNWWQQVGYDLLNKVIEHKKQSRRLLVEVK